MKKIITLLILLQLSHVSYAQLVEADLVNVWTGSWTYSNGYIHDEPSAGSPEDLSLLQDNSSLTGLRAEGQANFTQPNGAVVNFGGYIILEFQTNGMANDLHINIQGISFIENVIKGSFAMWTISPSKTHVYYPESSNIVSVSGVFDENGNNFDLAQEITINDIRLPDNRFQLMFQGPFIGGLAAVYPAPVGIELFEAHAYYSIPEPCTLLFLGFGAMLIRKR